MHSLKTLIVPKLAMVMLAAMALSNQSLAADITLGGSVLVGGAINSPDGTTITPPCFDPNNRFKDCGDGTVYDKQTGLMWEKKTACAVETLADPHCVLNTYTWSAASPFTEPTGTLFSDIAAKLNGLNESTGLGGAPCFAGHCDWRIPTVGELQTILAACTNPSCIDPVFGPTQASVYWSSSSLASGPVSAWIVYFGSGSVNGNGKLGDDYARAVRSGR